MGGSKKRKRNFHATLIKYSRIMEILLNNNISAGTYKFALISHDEKTTTTIRDGAKNIAKKKLVINISKICTTTQTQPDETQYFCVERKLKFSWFCFYLFSFSSLSVNANCHHRRLALLPPLRLLSATFFHLSDSVITCSFRSATLQP